MRYCSDGHLVWIGIDRVSGRDRPPCRSIMLAPAGTPVPTRTAGSSARHSHDMQQWNPISTELLRIVISVGTNRMIDWPMYKTNFFFINTPLVSASR
jgi:hypothetical protein